MRHIPQWKEPPSPDLAQQILEFRTIDLPEICNDNPPPVLARFPTTGKRCVEVGKVSIREIMDICCEVFGLSKEQLCGRRQSRDLVYPRHVAMSLAHQFTSLSFPQIGRYFNRDHATIQYACQTIADKLSSDPELYDKANRAYARCVRAAS